MGFVKFTEITLFTMHNYRELKPLLLYTTTQPEGNKKYIYIPIYNILRRIKIHIHTMVKAILITELATICHLILYLTSWNRIHEKPSHAKHTSQRCTLIKKKNSCNPNIIHQTKQQPIVCRCYHSK